jgi:hypothetical protein
MDSWCILLGLAMILHSRLIQTEFVNNVTQKLISSFLYEYRISFAVFIGCGAKGTGYIKVQYWNVNCALPIPNIRT